jgi:hypothetical protein
VGVFDGEAAMSLRSVPVCIRAAEDATHPDRGQIKMIAQFPTQRWCRRSTFVVCR